MRFLIFASFWSVILLPLITHGTEKGETVPLNQLSHIHGLAVDVDDPSRLYLATHHGLFLASPDGTAVRVSQSQDDLMGFVSHPGKGDVFYASGHPATGGNLGFIVSTDGGQTWTQRSAGVHGPVDFHALTISKTDPTTLYGTHGGLQVSHDSGQSWKMVGKLPKRTIDLSVTGSNAETLYAATAKGLLLSPDGGQSWRPAALFRGPATLVETDHKGNIYAFVVGTGLLKSAGGTTWKRLNSAFGEEYFLHLAIDPTDSDKLYAVTQDSTILASDDGGNNWHPWPENTQ